MIGIRHIGFLFFQRYGFLFWGLCLLACENNVVTTKSSLKPPSGKEILAPLERGSEAAEDTLGKRLQSLGLVEVRTYHPEIRVELKYAGTDNFMKQNVYGNLQGAYLQEDVAKKLARAQDLLTELDSNLFLLVYDAVRPVWVQQVMWDLLDSIPVSQREQSLCPIQKTAHCIILAQL
jgi:hypothetical protein